MEWKITILCENTAPGAGPGLIGEHGFSAFVEVDGTKILFDTGQGFTLLHNAGRLGKDLRQVDALVLSHGHYDHAGGMLGFLGVKGPCDVHAHPDVVRERFWKVQDGDSEKLLSIGIPWHQAYLETRGASFKWMRDFSEIAPRVFVSGEIPRVTSFEKGDPKMSVKVDGQWVRDPFLDDFSLALKTPEGLVVVLGCAHAGLINIIRHLVEKTGEDRILAVLGGTHLGFYSEDILETTIAALKPHGVKTLAVSHCTGQKAASYLATVFGPGFAFGHVGYSLSGMKS